MEMMELDSMQFIETESYKVKDSVFENQKSAKRIGKRRVNLLNN